MSGGKEGWWGQSLGQLVERHRRGRWGLTAKGLVNTGTCTLEVQGVRAHVLSDCTGVSAGTCVLKRIVCTFHQDPNEIESHQRCCWPRGYAPIRTFIVQIFPTFQRWREELVLIEGGTLNIYRLHVPPSVMTNSWPAPLRLSLPSPYSPGWI